MGVGDMGVGEGGMWIIGVYNGVLVDAFCAATQELTLLERIELVPDISFVNRRRHDFWWLNRISLTT